MPQGSPAFVAPRNLAAIDKAAQDFEAHFASEFLESMFSSIEADPLFGGGEGENVFRSFLLQEYGKALAANGSLGISNLVRQELLKAQENTR